MICFCCFYRCWGGHVATPDSSLDGINGDYGMDRLVVSEVVYHLCVHCMQGLKVLITIPNTSSVLWEIKVQRLPRVPMVSGMLHVFKEAFFPYPLNHFLHENDNFFPYQSSIDCLFQSQMLCIQMMLLAQYSFLHVSGTSILEMFASDRILTSVHLSFQ